MRMVCQRVLEAQVTVNPPPTGPGAPASAPGMVAINSGEGPCAKQPVGAGPVGKIGKGLLVFLSVGKGDTENDAAFMADKIVNLRIFADEAGKMNRSVQDVGGAILVISNFTLHGDCRKGRRPGFDAAADPTLAQPLYEKVCTLVAQQGVPVEKGVFGEYMHVTSINDGPVTFLLDSSRLF